MSTSTLHSLFRYKAWADGELLHLVTHGGYHRGAIGRVLVQCGIAPPRDTLTTFLHRSEPERHVGCSTKQ